MLSPGRALLVSLPRRTADAPPPASGQEGVTTLLMNTPGARLLKRRSHVPVRVIRGSFLSTKSESRMIINDTESADIHTATGSMRTYLFRPTAEGRYPGLVLFSEIFQVTGPIRRAAAMLASHGFVVAVPEIFHELEPAGTVLAYDGAGAERGNRNKITKTLSSYDTDARALLDYLAASPHCTGKLGVMGICIGGHLAFRAAMQPDVRATACFYATDLHKGSLGPTGDDSLARAGDIKGELM